MRLLALLAAALILVQGITPTALAAVAAGTCVSEGVKYNCVTESVRMREYRALYDNGLEGNVNMSNYTSPMQSFPSTVRGVAVPEGVWIGGSFESLARIYAWNNGTALPNASVQPYYYASGYGSPVKWAYGMLRDISFSVTFNATDVMNGATVFYYHSPVLHDTNVSHHLVEITESNGDIVAGNLWSYDNLGKCELRHLRYTCALTGVLQSGKTYTITEYSAFNYTDDGSGGWVPVPGKGRDSIDVFLAPDQDVSGDGSALFSAFVATPQQVIIHHDLSYAFKFTAGLSEGGPMGIYKRPLDRAYTVDAVRVEQGNISAGSTRTDTNLLHVIIPLETTVPLNVTLTISPASGWTGTITQVTVPGVTGTINERIPVSDFSSTSSEHKYNIKVHAQFDNRRSETLQAFKMPASDKRDANGDAIQHISYSYSLDTGPGLEGCDVAPGCPRESTHHAGAFWVEIREENVATPTSTSFSLNAESFLIGVALFTFGVLLVSTGIAAPVGVALAVYGSSVLVRAIIRGNEGNIVASDIQRFLTGAAAAVETAAPFVAAAACGGMFFAPGMWKVAAGATCALAGGIVAAGGLPGLLDFFIKIPEIVKMTVEKVAELLVFLLALAQTIIENVDTLVQWLFALLTISLVVLLVREAIHWGLLLLRVLMRALRNSKADTYLTHLAMLVATLPIPIWDSIFHRKFNLARGEFAPSPPTKTQPGW